jgi:hypothetical protein
MICRSPYAGADNDDGDDGNCEAIRLTHCGHIIGDRCFYSWIIRQPDICPYWSHHLPPVLHETGSLPERLLGRVCKGAWFQFFEHPELGILPQMESVVASTNALLQDQLNLLQALKLLLFYEINGCFASFLIGFLIMVVLCIITFGCWGAALLLTLPYYGGLEFTKTFFAVAVCIKPFFHMTFWAVFLNTLAFDVVVLGVLSLGLSRSFLNACHRFLDRVLEKLN